jgi:hypothetical protein
MTAATTVEQSVTSRPNSFVPGRTLTAVSTGRRLPGSARPLVRNHLMHWGTGAALGALRGVWSASGLRGWRASAWHTSVRLASDRPPGAGRPRPRPGGGRPLPALSTTSDRGGWGARRLLGRL